MTSGQVHIAKIGTMPVCMQAVGGKVVVQLRMSFMDYSVKMTPEEIRKLISAAELAALEAAGQGL